MFYGRWLNSRQKRKNIDVKRYFCRNSTYFTFNLLPVICFMEKTAVIFAAREFENKTSVFTRSNLISIAIVQISTVIKLLLLEQFNVLQMTRMMLGVWRSFLLRQKLISSEKQEEKATLSWLIVFLRRPFCPLKMIKQWKKF